MNWTEGKLNRHSRGKRWNEEAARQKQYFAKRKARHHQQQGNSTTASRPTSFIPNYIPQNPPSQRSDASGSTSSRNRDTVNSRKRLIYLAERLDPPAGLTDLSHPGRETGSPGVPGELEAKRRKLLEKNDWTGIEFQRPLFPASLSNRPRVAVTHNQNASQQKPRHGHEQRAALKDGLRVAKKQRQHSGSPRDRHGRIDIRVGSQDYRWSHGSNSVRSHPTAPGSLPSFQEWMSQADMPSSRRASSPAASKLSSLRNTPLGRRDARVRDRSSLASAEARTGRDNATTSTCHGNSDAQIIIHSSPPMIHHPQPSRMESSLLLNLRSPGSDDMGSTTAQVDEPTLVDSDDDEWRSWLKSPRGKRPSSHWSKELPPRPITPGISNYSGFRRSRSPSSDEQIPRPARQLEPTEAVYATDALPDVEMDEVSPAPRCSSSLGTDDVISVEHGSRSSSRSHTRSGDQCTSEDLAASDSVVIVPSEDSPSPREAGQPAGDAAIDQAYHSEDDEEIWKTFVFDDDSVEITRKAVEEAHEQTRRQLRELGPQDSDVVEPPSMERKAHSPSPTVDSPEPMAIDMPSLNKAMINPPHDIESSIAGDSTDARLGSPQPNQDDARPQSSETRFHQPRLFIGMLASLQASSTIPTSTAARSETPKGPFSTGAKGLQQGEQDQINKGRARVGSKKKMVSRKGRRDSGRPDIRALPNFDGDPIEESP